MPIPRPYRRIIRPISSLDNYVLGYNSSTTHVADDRYADDRYEIIRAYHILEKDLINLFEYVEPSDSNLNTYSHRIYELLLRASTEFELNAKKILEANGYTKAGNLNITDYYKINAATRLSEYRLYINVWANGKKEIKPFDEWTNGHSLSWYQDYNKVKHNRHDEFARASLENLLSAVAAVYSIVFSQFHMFIFSAFQPAMGYHTDDDTNEISSAGTLFSIVLPQTWTPGEMYQFNWATLRSDPNPFDMYPFQI